MKNIFALQFPINMTEGQQYVKFCSPIYFETLEDVQFYKDIHVVCFP